MAEDNNAPLDEAAIQAKIAEAVNSAVEGLKRTNNELKGEKTELKEKFDDLSKTLEGLGGVDVLKSLGNADTIKQLADMKKRFEADEQGKLLSEGKYDEWFDKRTAAMRKDHESQIKAVQTKLEEQTKRGDEAVTKFRNKVLETEVSNACLDAKVEVSAHPDVRLRAASIFGFDESRDAFVLKDSEGGVVFGKDGVTPKNIREWLEDQKETSRHWWPASQTGNVRGTDKAGEKARLGGMDMAEYAKTRREQGFKSF